MDPELYRNVVPKRYRTACGKWHLWTAVAATDMTVITMDHRHVRAHDDRVNLVGDTKMIQRQTLERRFPHRNEQHHHLRFWN